MKRISKISLIFALMAGFMLPLTTTAMADSSSSSKSKSKKKKPKPKPKPETVEQDNSGANEAEKPKKGIMSSEQILINNEAIEAVSKGDFGKAEKLFVALQQLGEFNVVWYQLGGTYQREDKCVEAYDAYSRVADAPILDDEDYTPEVILEETKKAIATLDAQCSAKLVFTCDPPEMKLSIDNGAEFDCNSNTIPAVPGKHFVHAKTSKGINDIEVDAIANQVNNITVKVNDPTDILKDQLEEYQKRSTLFKALGYSFLGVGVALGSVA